MQASKDGANLSSSPSNAGSSSVNSDGRSASSAAGAPVSNTAGVPSNRLGSGAIAGASAILLVVVLAVFAL